MMDREQKPPRDRGRRYFLGAGSFFRHCILTVNGALIG